MAVTGPQRRQRLGQLLTGTVVVAEGVPWMARPAAPARFGDRLNRPPTELALPARGAATLIDGAIGLLAMFCAVPLGEAAMTAAMLLCFVPLPLLFELTTEASIGKHCVGLRVEMADGRRVTPLAAVLRNVLRLIDFVPLAYASGLATMLTGGREKRQRIGDRAARTVVVPNGRKWVRSFPRGVFPAVGVATIAAAGAVYVLTGGPLVAPWDDGRGERRAEAREVFVKWCAKADVATGECGCVFDRVGIKRIDEVWGHRGWNRERQPADVSRAIASCYR